MTFYWLITLAVPLVADDCANRLQQSRRAFQDRDFALAERTLQQTLGICAQREEILLELANAQMLAQHLQDAERTLLQLLRVQPRHAPALKLRGDVLYLLGKEEDAEQQFLAASSANPSSPDPHYALGRLFYHQSRFAQAVSRFQRVIELEPSNFRAHDNLGLCFDALNDIPRAMASYEKALALVHTRHPRYDVVYANLADLLHRQGEFERSFQFAAEAAKRNPASARNFFLTGRALAKLERWDLAEKWLRQTLALDSSHAAAHYQLAQVYRVQGREEDADRELRAFQSATAVSRAGPKLH